MSRCVLVIDDDPEFRRVIVPVLERRGLAVLEAESAAEASACLEKARREGAGVALIVLDGVLPDETGLAWLAGRRRDGDATPAIYVTAFPHDLPTLQRLTVELSVAQIVYKPVIPSVFGAVVDHVLDTTPSVPDDVPPDMGDAYAEALAAKVNDLAHAVAQARADERDALAWDEARMRAHRLRGSAGTYGFGAVGEAAGRVEDGLRSVLAAGEREEERAAAWARIDRALEETSALASAGASPRETTGSVQERPRTPSSPLTATTARVLVADADEETQRELAVLGRAQCIEVLVADDAATALALARDATLDAAFIDVDVPGDANAFRLARDLRALSGKERLPIAFMSEAGGFAHRVAAAHAGASLYLSKPIDAYAFGTAVENLVSQHHNERARVLIVDDDEDFVITLGEVLKSHGIGAITLTDPARILEVVESEDPDLVLLDVMLPGVSGFDIARMLRTTQRWQDLPILFLTGRADLESRLAAFEAGGDDYLAKPIVEEELLARVRVRLDRRRLMRELTEKDPLTKLLSRRALLEALASRLSESRRHGRRLSLALLDVDRFKWVNDTFGHVAGDHVLATLGRLLAERFRLEDMRGRWGGEEFVIVFPNETADTAARVLRRVLDELRAVTFGGDRGDPFHVSFSAGVASFPEDGATVEALLKAADRRLYAAKDAGRARVFAPGEEPADSERAIAVGAKLGGASHVHH